MIVYGLLMLMCFLVGFTAGFHADKLVWTIRDQRIRTERTRREEARRTEESVQAMRDGTPDDVR